MPKNLTADEKNLTTDVAKKPKIWYNKFTPRILAFFEIDNEKEKEKKPMKFKKEIVYKSSQRVHWIKRAPTL